MSFLPFIQLLLLLLSRFSRVQLCATPWTAAHQAPPSMGFSGQEYWSGLLCLPPAWTVLYICNSVNVDPMNKIAKIEGKPGVGLSQHTCLSTSLLMHFNPPARGEKTQHFQGWFPPCSQVSVLPLVAVSRCTS